MDLDINSRRDKFYLKNVGHIHGLTNFSLVEIDELTQKFNLTSKYGDVDVKSFSDEVESFKINSSDADITLHFIDNKHYKLDATVDDRTEVMYSADIKNISSKELGGDEKLIEVKCLIGTDKTRTIPVKMDELNKTMVNKLGIIIVSFFMFMILDIVYFYFVLNSGSHLLTLTISYY